MAPLATGYVLVLLLFLGLPWSNRINPNLVTDAARTRSTSMALGTVHLLALVLPMAGVLAQIRPVLPPAIAWSALGFMAAGLLLQQWSQRSLGANFTLALQSASYQQVHQDGPYRWIRHPAYLAQIVFFGAFGLTSGSGTVAAVVGFAVIVAYVFRIREEEHMMLAAKGSDYSQYMASSMRLVPFIW